MRMRSTLALVLMLSGCVPRSIAGIPSPHAWLDRDGPSVRLSLSCSTLDAKATLNGAPMDEVDRGGPPAPGRALAGLESPYCRTPTWSGRPPVEQDDLELRVKDDSGEFVVQVSAPLTERRLKVERANGQLVPSNTTVLVGDDDVWVAQLEPDAHIVEVETSFFTVSGERVSVDESRKLAGRNRFLIPAPVTAGRLEVRVHYELPFRCSGPHGLTCSASPRTCVDCAFDVETWTVNVSPRPN